MDDSISILAKTREDFIRQVKEYAKTDVPEGKHYFKISATLLAQLIQGEKDGA